jgi:serine/threonine protein kinase
MPLCDHLLTSIARLQQKVQIAPLPGRRREAQSGIAGSHRVSFILRHAPPALALSAFDTERLPMGPPGTATDFLDLVRKSGLVDERLLDSYLQKIRDAGATPEKSDALARLLIRDGILTKFQAGQLLQGRWRRFIIGKYKILEPLGAGGMARVYLCEHKFMRRRVAVKVLPASKAQDVSARERFYREARAVAALDHPNIVRAYDIDQDGDLHFLIMEHIDGPNLQELVKQKGPLEFGTAANYIRQAALGLQHAHERAGIIHRDIKPGNILVDRTGIVKLLDLGLARFFHDTDDKLTKELDEKVLGTADYLAPEQVADGSRVDIRADIYSLGATFYFLLTGQPPFGKEAASALKRIWHQVRQPKPVQALRPDIPEGLAQFVAKMMAKEPAKRYQTPLEVAEALGPWAHDAVSPPPRDGKPA